MKWYSAELLKSQWHKPYGHFMWYGWPGGIQELANEVHLNSRGYNDAEHTLAKPPGTYRILILGDSYVEAVQVPREKTVSHVLQTELNKVSAATVEVIGLGVSNYGQIDEYALLKQEGMTYSPDLVISEFLAWNDVRDNCDPIKREVAEYEKHIIGPWREGPFLLIFPLRHSDFLVRVTAKLNSLYHTYHLSGRTDFEKVHPLTKIFLRNWNNPVWEKGWEITFNTFKEEKQFCDTYACRLAIASFSSQQEINAFIEKGSVERQWSSTYPPPVGAVWDTTYPSERMGNFCKANSIPYINLIPPLADYARQHNVNVHFIKGEEHWNENGHRATAEALCKFIIQQGFIKVRNTK